MKNKTKFLIALALTVIINCSYSQLNEQWEAIYNGTADNCDIPTALQIDVNGNVYTAGYSKGINTGNFDLALVKYNSAGEQQWAARYNGPVNNTDEPNGMVISGNNIFVAGFSDAAPFMAIYDQNGNLVTTYKLTLPGQFKDIKKDNFGNVIISGYHKDSLILVKFSSNGSFIWHKNYRHPGSGTLAGNNSALKIAVNDNGSIYTCGNTIIQNEDGLLVKFDVNGNVLWAKTYTFGFQDITLLGSGSVCLIANPGANTGAVLCYSSQGNLIWSSTNESNHFYKIVSDELNNIYIGTQYYSDPEHRGPGIIKYSQSGHFMWHRYHYPATYAEFFYDIKVKNCFNIYISYLGVKQGFPSYSGITKFNSNGYSRWNFNKNTIVYDTSLGTGNHLMAFGNYNTLYTATTGISNPRKNDFLTAKYTENFYSVSGLVTYKDNNQPVNGGFVKALYYDESTSGIVTVDSAEIQTDGSYTLTKMPEDTLDLMFYQDDDLLQFVPTYYVSTIDWREATKIYPTQNLTNINCQVYRIENQSSPFTISGHAIGNLNNLPSGMQDAVIYAKTGSIFKNYGISIFDGSYIITKLPTGSYTLIAHRMGFAPLTQDVTITNSNLNNINFDLGNPLIGIEVLSSKIPVNYYLSQNYPNPFNPSTRIKFGIPTEGFVSVRIFDVLGRLISTPVNENLRAGSYEVNWNSEGLTSGVYFYRIESGSYIKTLKMVLLK